ncbi:hypothetical protein SMACR_07489 [Sordaria macrospora]|uniref:WGS project CABT00000000 data, contig 2.46 n=2 Tax=Sordaria macrospora TaxID=5147 RepID=F7W8R7_SORMK|nr:uncharacterized protein SMAC_07489 [Sordaria macrospora k-hell]KAA8632550.1 hypothetical protein SMACR_07489 [Sordaria macrospora]KAH7628009.1 hypothetical protein B0T09DRAFT_375776 [Sordaria sp. MPI-SDFR-AT-0083]WPJ65461.1 hypothetical protein SMAC4_07489 [Sordaria macrospora]CCC13853.1 unnamed protein product [Sordaria macrospora k-hell]
MRHKQDINKWHETQSSNLPVHQLERALSPTLFDRSPPRRTSNSVAGKLTSQGRQPGTISEDKRKSRQSEDSEELKESSKASTEMESQFGEHIDELVNEMTEDGQKKPDKSDIAAAARSAISQAQRMTTISPTPTMRAIVKSARAHLSYVLEMRKLGMRGLDWDAKINILDIIIYLAEDEVQGLMYEDLRKRTNPDGEEDHVFVPVPGRLGLIRSNFGSNLPRSSRGSNRDLNKNHQEEKLQTVSEAPSPAPSVATDSTKESGENNKERDGEDDSN